MLAFILLQTLLIPEETDNACWVTVFLALHLQCLFPGISEDGKWQGIFSLCREQPNKRDKLRNTYISVMRSSVAVCVSFKNKKATHRLVFAISQIRALPLSVPTERYVPFWLQLTLHTVSGGDACLLSSSSPPKSQSFVTCKGTTKSSLQSS